MDEKNLEHYVGKVLQLAKNSENKLSEQELADLALQLGVNWEVICKERDTHIKKGNTFFANELYADAIEEYKQVLVLHPSQRDAVVHIGLAYVALWRKNMRKDDKENAEKYLREAIHLYPDEEVCYQALKKIRGKNSPKNTNHQKSNNGKVLIAVLIAAAVLASFLLIYFFWGHKEGADALQNNKVQTPKTQVAENTEINNYVPDENAEKTLSVNFDFAETEKLSFELHESKFNDYENSYSMTVSGYLKVGKNYETGKLKIKVQGLDDKGKVLFTEYQNLHELEYFTYRPNDLLPFYFLKYEKEKAVSVPKEIRISVSEMNVFPAASSYKSGKKIDFIWECAEPENVKISANLLNEKLSEAGFGKQEVFYRFALEIANEGNRSVKDMLVGVEYFDSKGKSLGQFERYVLSEGNSPPIKGGQKRILGSIGSVKGIKINQVAEVKFKVLNIE
jgi:tetratricopeptide (TPR) repeat protein